VAAILDFELSKYELFEGLKCSNSEFQLISPIFFTGTFVTKVSRFGLAGVTIAAILDF